MADETVPDEEESAPAEAATGKSASEAPAATEDAPASAVEEAPAVTAEAADAGKASNDSVGQGADISSAALFEEDVLVSETAEDVVAANGTEIKFEAMYGILWLTVVFFSGLLILSTKINLTPSAASVLLELVSLWIGLLWVIMCVQILDAVVWSRHRRRQSAKVQK